MLQLDSSFTARDYGSSSFRHFVEMLAKERLVEINRVSGHYLVEIPRPEEAAKADEALPKREDALPALHKALRVIDENDLWGKLEFDAVKEYVQRVEPDFDEKRYGFGQFAELLNFAQDVGLVRLEPDSDSLLRVYSGSEFTPTRGSFAKPAGHSASVQNRADEPSSESGVMTDTEEIFAVAPIAGEEAAAPATESSPSKPKRSYHRPTRGGSRSRTPRKPAPTKS
jgi:hypothetical protein